MSTQAAPRIRFGDLGKAGREKFERVMGEFRDRRLRHGKKDDLVTSRDQAFAVAMSEGRRVDQETNHVAERSRF